jgi:NAD(P)-dependent dehydrogenase (short-subunit alcohol dehydrogenase family)
MGLLVKVKHVSLLFAKEIDMKRFEGKSVLVTGAGSGIGRATALRFAAEGARVACADINERGLEETAIAIRAAGGVVATKLCDVSKPDAVTSTVAFAVKEHGGLYALANVAGIGGFQRTSEVTLDLWNRFISINLTGAFLMCQAALPHILEAKGAIVNTGSVAGIKSHPYSAAYCASKGGVVLMTKALAVEYGRKGIRINVVCPGGVETPLIQDFKLPEGVSQAALQKIMPLGRLGKPEEVAGTIAFLCSEDAAYINGSAIVVDGGMTA